MSRARGGRRREELTDTDRDAMLAALKHSRAELIKAHARLRAQGPMYLACSSVVAAIDMLAYRLTGEPNHFAVGFLPPIPPEEAEEINQN